MLNQENEIKNINKRLKINSIDEIEYFPKYIEIESYDGCNFDCVMCPLGKSIYKGGGAISSKLFDKVVSEIAPYKDWIKHYYNLI